MATVSQNAKPNVSPKGTLVALDQRRLAFADIRSPDTVSNIVNNPHVEISAIDPISRRGYLFAGIARTITNGEEFDRVSKIYEEMKIQSTIKAIIIVELKTVSKVTSPLYDLGVSESQIRESWIRRYTEN